MDQRHWLELIQSALVGEKIGDRRGSTGTRRLIQQFVSQMTVIFWIDLQCTGASVDFILFSGMSDTRDLLRFFNNGHLRNKLLYSVARDGYFCFAKAGDLILIKIVFWVFSKSAFGIQNLIYHLTFNIRTVQLKVSRNEHTTLSQNSIICILK